MPQFRTISSMSQFLIDHAETLRASIQERLEREGFYSSRVKKESWPKDTGHQIEVTDLKGFGVTVHTISLKKAAVNSPDMCVDDLAYGTDKQLKQTLDEVETLLYHQVGYMWEETFRNEIYKTIDRDNHSISLDRPRTTADPKYPRKVNFFGRRVYPFVTRETKYGGIKAFVNRKYKHAAEQVITFRPDLISFLFPDGEQQWVGRIMWRCIPDRECATHGEIGFYRVIFGYAARPLITTQGTVVTVMPPGIRGWLWYWIWKLLRYVP